MTTQEAINDLAEGCNEVSHVVAKLAAADCMKSEVRGQRCRTCPVAVWLQKKTGKVHSVDMLSSIEANPAAPPEVRHPDIIRGFILHWDGGFITEDESTPNNWLIHTIRGI